MSLIKVNSIVKMTAIASLLAASIILLSACGREQVIPVSNPKKIEANPVKDNEAPYEERPNIVYILLDDAGFSDLGSYGSEIKTPNIDKLAANGLRYNNFNANPMCSPTRASLLTGRNHHSVGMGNISNFELGPDSHSQGRIKDEAATSAEILKENGYSTFAVSKWHASPPHEITPAGPFNNWPLGKGFERYYGILESHTDQFSPELVYDNHMIGVPAGENYHLSEDFVDHAKQFVTDQVSIMPDKPFHLYLGFGAVHAPIQVPQEYIDMYSGAYDKGWDEIRKERFERQKKLGIIPENTEFLPRDPAIKAWDSLTEDEKKLYARFQEAYAGFMTHTDEQIGRFVTHLEEIGELDNTLIVLLSDNGASMEGLNNGSASFLNYVNRYSETLEDLLEVKEKIGGPEVRAAYPMGWAQVSSTPFKNYKQTVHNGGTRVPFIIHWPSRIKDKGEIRDQYHHVIDVTPTVLDLLEIQAPEMYNGIEQMPLHGVSMAYSFDEQEASSKRTTQYYSMQGSRAIVNNDWKAVTFHPLGEPYENDQWELYDLSTDFSEANDLAEKHPDKLRKLQKLWQSEAEKYGALPFEFNPRELTYVNPDAVNSRNLFTYYQGTGHLGTGAAPRIQNRSYTVTATVNRKDEKTEGVLVAHGDHLSGYTLYVKNNQLIYEYNHLGTLYKIISKTEVPVGESTLKFEFQKTGEHKGSGLLFIEDKKVGEVNMPKTFAGALAEEGLDIGRDLLSSVSSNYGTEKDFEFNGKIYKVEYDLKND